MKREKTAPFSKPGPAAPRAIGGIASRLGALFLLVITALSAPAGQQLHGQLPLALKTLKPVARLAPATQMNLVIGLPLRNQAGLNQLLREVYDPGSPGFRHYLAPDEFARRFGPSEEDYQSLITFATSHGFKVTGIHPNRTLLDISGSAAVVEQAFHVSLGVFQHPNEKRTFYAPNAEPAVDLATPILGISGLDDYSRPRPCSHSSPLAGSARPDAGSGSGPNGAFSGPDFRAAYAANVPFTGAGQKVGLLEFDGYTAADITYYETKAGLSSVPLINVLLDGFNGRPTENGGEIEVSLDIETAIAMAPKLSGVIVYMAGPDGSFDDILNRMATDNLAKQLACCWHSTDGLPDPVSDQIFQQMAAQGQSFFAASGDDDAFTAPVDFPSDNPNITLVGGTALITSAPGGTRLSETVWNQGSGIGSGGGISSQYAIPFYQTNISMTLNHGSTTLRNVPDVAMVAQEVYTRANSHDYTSYGTSCAAPLWAAFVALANQEATAQGAPIGFINPALDRLGHLPNYTNLFHDITVGGNTSSGSPSQFYAVPGYDLCTGWGTPNGRKLIDALAIPDWLLISPAQGPVFIGPVGGPFSPKSSSFALTNAGATNITWTLVNTSSWLSVSSTQGTLLARGKATNLVATLNPAVTNLPAGIYPATLLFTNLASGLGQSRSMTLTVVAPGMADDFEPGIDLTQWTSFGGPVGTGVLANNYGGSVSGSNSLWFGGSGSRYAATVPINTVAGGEIGFCLRLGDGDAPWALVDDLSAEGITLEYSINAGVNWTALSNFNSSAYYDWTGVVLPIPTAARTAATLFRWRQLNNSGEGADNWALDNVSVQIGSALKPQLILQPQGETVLAGDPVTLNAAVLGSLPLSYQWRLNGTNIKNANASSLSLPAVQLTNAGVYSVMVSNHFGTVLSSNAVVTVTQLPAALVSWWRAEGDARDAMGLNNGTLVNGAIVAPGKIGQAFKFNGVNQCVTIPYSKTLVAPNFSISAWVEPLAQVGNDINQYLIFGQGYGWQLVAHSSGSAMTLTFEFAESPDGFDGVTSATTIPIGKFSHLVGTSDGATLRLYINGVLNAQANPHATPADPGYPFYIGGFDIQTGATYSDQYFNGLVDEVGYFGRALTAPEVQTLYNTGPGSQSSSSPPSILVEKITNGVFRLTSHGAAGFPCRFQVASNLFHPVWTDLGTVTADSSGTSQYLDQPPANTQARFYRALAP